LCSIKRHAAATSSDIPTPCTFLTEEERATAPLLHGVLSTTARALTMGRQADVALADAGAELSNAGFAIDYLALVDGVTMQVLQMVRPGSRLIAAARLGSVRLIDNLGP